MTLRTSIFLGMAAAAALSGAVALAQPPDPNAPILKAIQTDVARRAAPPKAAPQVQPRWTLKLERVRDPVTIECNGQKAPVMLIGGERAVVNLSACFRPGQRNRLKVAGFGTGRNAATAYEVLKQGAPAIAVGNRPARKNCARDRCNGPQSDELSFDD